MVLTPSQMVDLGSAAPDFSLPDTNGQTVSRSDFAAKPLFVMFMCNHCPFVIHLRASLASVAKEYQANGVAVVGISSNDVVDHPDDSPAKMVEAVREFGYTFPYLYDESQAVAKAYRAACTPDFFLYDADHKLAYRGQWDEARPESDAPVTGEDIRAAMDAVLAGKAPTADQKNSIGCNIKWSKGNEPDYFGD